MRGWGIELAAGQRVFHRERMTHGLPVQGLPFAEIVAGKPAMRAKNRRFGRRRNRVPTIQKDAPRSNTHTAAKTA
jgi:hypothetical protein